MNKTSDIRASLHKAIEEASTLVKSDFEAALSNGVSFDEKPSVTGLPDFVTKTDKRSEETLRAKLYDLYPDIPFIGEESGGTPPEDKGYFLVDPLDGTSNFTSLRSYFGICAAYIEQGNVLAAAVADPINNKIFSAEKESGAYLNNRLIHPLPSSHIDDTLKSTQLECELTFTSEEDFSIVQRVLPALSGLRKSGSVALDLAYMASGRKTVCLANHLQPYDIAAAMLIAREAGCIVSDFEGKNATINTSAIIAARQAHHNQILSLIKK